MSYLVMEVHPAYAVVLDEEGRFLKAANLRYQVGDTVRDIVELRHPREKRPALWKPLSGVAGLAACLCLVFFGYYQPNFTPYGALRIQINPDVELTLSRTDRVLELEGLNEDGQSLIAGYEYSGKDREDDGELVWPSISIFGGDGVHHGHQRRRRLSPEEQRLVWRSGTGDHRDQIGPAPRAADPGVIPHAAPTDPRSLCRLTPAPSAPLSPG
ncbi:MAG: hypothetical protein ACLUHL_13395 [Dysosmobacter welbionis]